MALQEKIQAEDVEVADKKVLEIIGGMMDFESEDFKEIMLKNIQDKNEFVSKYEDMLDEKKAKDDIRVAEELENKFYEIDQQMKALFVVGDYEQHYLFYERAAMNFCSLVSADLKSSAVRYFSGKVSLREAKKVMRNLEHKIRKYESRLTESMKREEKYQSSMLELKSRVRRDDCNLLWCVNNIEDAEKKIRDLEEEESDYLKEGNDEEASKISGRIAEISTDVSRAAERKNFLTQEINKNSAIYYRKQVAYEKARFSRGEYLIALNAMKSHFEILKNNLDDYHDGIPFEIKEGRMMIRDARERDDRMRKIDQATFSALQMAYSTPRNLTGLEPAYMGDEIDSLKSTGIKAQEESYHMARRNAERILNRRR